jgi:phosphopantothenoylcysteine decarboxylase/phosphopantothenate--cysteine ligase
LKNALITIGCTREYIDPVRYISNESSGRQGIDLIKSLLKFNYKVICLHGYLQTKQIVSKNVKFIFTPTADEMLKEAKKYKSIDLGIFNAAVSDYKAKKYNKLKIKKKNGMSLKLINNPDILKSMSFGKYKPKITVGFAYETDDVFQNAKEKLLSKNCDYLVLNFPTAENKIFNSKYNNGILIGRSGDFLNLGNVTKTIFANKIVKYISNRKN